MADPSVIAAVIGDVAQQAQHGIEALVPWGEQVAGSLIVLSIVGLGLAVMTGGSAFLPMLVRTCLLAAGTLWALRIWPTFVRDVVDGSHWMVGRIAGTGYSGPADLFALAEDTAARMV